jgi:hypothetical protein
LSLIVQYHYDAFVSSGGGVLDSSQPATSPPPTSVDKREGGRKPAHKHAKGAASTVTPDPTLEQHGNKSVGDESSDFEDAVVPAGKRKVASKPPGKPGKAPDQASVSRGRGKRSEVANATDPRQRPITACFKLEAARGPAAMEMPDAHAGGARAAVELEEAAQTTAPFSAAPAALRLRSLWHRRGRRETEARPEVNLTRRQRGRRPWSGRLRAPCREFQLRLTQPCGGV